MTYSKDSIVFAPISTNPRFIDLTGQRFGRLTVLGLAQITLKESLWWCECDCGTITQPHNGSLKQGHSKSCGCLQRELAAITHATQNGRSKHPLFNTWAHMHQRCYNPNTKCYHRYGGRGIIVCPEWHEFETFAADMEPRPSLKHSLNRIDNNGMYCAANCEWATAIEQNNNRENNRRIRIDDDERTLVQWLRHFQITSSTFYDRIAKGWSEIEALSVPPYGRC